MAIPKTRNDFGGVTTIDAAKDYDYYKNQKLTAPEKEIFASDLLKIKNADGTLSDDPNLDDLRDTMALLFNLQEAKDKLADEQNNSSENLTYNGNLLLTALMGERRNRSVAYQLTNTKENSEKQVDKIVKDYQQVMFRRVNRTLQAEEKVAMIALNKAEKKVIDQNSEIEKARGDINKHLSVDDAKKYKTKVGTIVTALKADLLPGQPSRNFLDERVKNFQKVANINYRTSTSYSDSWGSVIKTSIEPYYSDSPYSHPRFLASALPYQMLELFREFDKVKLFALVERKFPAKFQIFKKSFERVLGLRIKSGVNNSSKRENWDYFALSATEEVYKKRFGGDKGLYFPRPEDMDEVEKNTFLSSDIFRIMDTLFPQADVATGYVDSPFLKAGNDALSFSGTNSLTTEHDIGWRGRIDDLSGKVYRELWTETNFGDSSINNLVSSAFPIKKLKLKWAGEKNKSSLPQFFWQIYDKPECVDFTFSREYLSRNGVDKNKFLENQLSAYESKLIVANNVFTLTGSSNELLGISYRGRVEDIMKGNGFSDEDIEKYWIDFEDAFYKIAKKSTATYHSFRETAQGITYDELKAKKLPISWIIEDAKSTLVDDELQEIWEKDMEAICDSKIGAAEQLRNKLGAELTKQNENNAQKNVAQKKLKIIQVRMSLLEKGKLEKLQVQFSTLGEKLITSSTNLKVITPQEAVALHNLYWVLKKIENKTDSALGVFDAYDATTITVNVNIDNETPPTTKAIPFKPRVYMNALKALEDKWAGVDKGGYETWKSLGSDFASRLASYQSNEGKNLEEESIKAYFESVKAALNIIKNSRSLLPEEIADLLSIDSYITKKSELRAGDIQLAFNIDKDIETTLVNEWKSYGDEKWFAKDSKKLKDIADYVNDLPDKIPFFDELKTYLTGKTGLPAMPDDTADEWTKLEYYFTLPPKHLIGAFAAYQIKKDATKKSAIETEIKDVKNPDDSTKGLNMTAKGYGDGTKFTEEGLIKYLAEKTGGIKHTYAATQKPNEDKGDRTEKPFWRSDNITAWFVGLGLPVLFGAAVLVILYWESIMAWWNGPADQEGNGGLEEDDD